jgi:transposase
MTREAVLTDAMWERLEPLLPPVQGARGRPATPHRPAVEGAISLPDRLRLA